MQIISNTIDEFNTSWFNSISVKFVQYYLLIEIFDEFLQYKVILLLIIGRIFVLFYQRD